jgi:vacuolar protein sorting-associated protein 13A/C
LKIGPAETASGLYRGTKSLISNTTVGALSSLGKMSSSFSSTLLNITGDTEFIQERNVGMIQQRPTGVLQGIGQGVGTALNSGWSGLKGLISKPSEGFQREGAVGFIKGALSGTAGLIVKPVTGTMDFVVKTSEGI